MIFNIFSNFSKKSRLVVRSLQQKLGQLKREIYTIYWAFQDSRVPAHAKIVAACVLAYAFSPIDLIPDFIPILGYLDDLIIIPLGIWLAIKMIPPPILRECREKAQATTEQKKGMGWLGAGVIIAIWIGLGTAVFLWLNRKISSNL